MDVEQQQRNGRHRAKTAGWRVVIAATALGVLMGGGAVYAYRHAQDATSTATPVSDTAGR
ncbi:MAG TPA: hypothetical protein VGJ14_16365 [Sporichthyaceae bacterium]|jgi:cobalamin biosynthesis protein CobD/CbiB